MPDYDVSRPDSTVVGWRTAEILLSLEKNYEQDSYNRLLAQIRNEQMGEIKQSFLPINNLKVTRIQKKDSVITITIHTLSKTEKRKKVECDLVLSFVNSLSASEMTNRLFGELGKYLKRKEE